MSKPEFIQKTFWQYRHRNSNSAFVGYLRKPWTHVVVAISGLVKVSILWIASQKKRMLTHANTGKFYVAAAFLSFIHSQRTNHTELFTLALICRLSPIWGSKRIHLPLVLCYRAVWMRFRSKSSTQWHQSIAESQMFVSFGWLNEIFRFFTIADFMLSKFHFQIELSTLRNTSCQRNHIN